MKHFKIILMAFLFSFSLLAISCGQDNETLYKGVVVDKHYVDPSAGYKSNNEEQYQIYLREDVTKKVIKILVDVPTYYDLKIGSRTAFKLSNRTMCVWGNTNSLDTNLYGK